MEMARREAHEIYFLGGVPGLVTTFVVQVVNT
jgi:hypothetical protein